MKVSLCLLNLKGPLNMKRELEHFNLQGEAVIFDYEEEACAIWKLRKNLVPFEAEKKAF